MPTGNFRDTVTRFKSRAQGFAVTWTTFNLGQQSFRDTVTRFRISLIQPVLNWRFTTMRLRLQGLSFVAVKLRFRLLVSKTRDTVIRFYLNLARHTSVRFNLVGLRLRDTVIRFLLSSPLRDTSTRFNLTARLRDTVIRLNLRATTFRDTVTRFCVVAFNYEQFANNASSFLTGALSPLSSQNTLTIGSAVLFPQRGYFRILIDSEIILVQEVHGNVFLVSRGAEGTTVASHANGANVYQIITAGSLESLYSEPLVDSSSAFMYDTATGDILVGRPYNVT